MSTLPTSSEPQTLLSKSLPLLGSVVYLGFCFLMGELIPLNQRPIPYQMIGDVVAIDQTLDQAYLPDSEETIPAWLLIVLGLFLPLFIVLLVTLFLPVPKPAELSGDAYSNLLPAQANTKGAQGRAVVAAFFIAAGTNLLFTDCIKHYVGRLRPNFYAMCALDTTGDEPVCTADESRIRESRSSFPSGHSSITACGMVFTALFAAGVIAPLFRGKRQAIAVGAIWVACGAVAAFVAASRLVDNWHHPSGVLAGGAIGAFSALGGYSLFAV